MKFSQSLFLGIGILTLSSLIPTPVRAQWYIPIGPGVEDVFDRAAFHHTGTFREITGVTGQLNNILGFRFLKGQPIFKGSYIDNLITADAYLLEAIYRDYLRQQTEGRPVRTQDLPNPFNSSLQQESSAIDGLP